MPKIDFIISERTEEELKRKGLTELATLEFWRKIMNHKYDKRIDIGWIYRVTETILCSNEHNEEIVAFMIDKENEKKEAEIVLVKRDVDDTKALIRAIIKFHYVRDGGAYDGMKNGFEMEVTLPCGYGSIELLTMYSKDAELWKKAIKEVLTSPRFGIKNIYF